MRAFLLALFLAAGAAAQPESISRPATGVDEPPRRGTFVESSLGAFTTFGGSARVARAQPYLSMTVGRELGERASVFASLGIGASSASCFSASKSNGDCAAADSFGATFVEAGASYGIGVALRTLLSLKILGGFTDLSPGPVTKNNGVPDHLPGFHLGGGLAL
ncbi:MAG: adventurous gliding motility protein CglE, partial [Deltaproteobacteria bacterium]